MQSVKNENEPAYYIFVAASLSHEPYTPGREIVQKLLAHGLWLASPKTPLQNALKAGDKILFYVGGSKARYFMAQAIIAGSTTRLEERDTTILESLGLIGFVKRIPLQEAHLWNEAVPLRPLVDRLHFVKNKRHYGLNLIKSIVRISEEDYRLLVGQAGSSG